MCIGSDVKVVKIRRHPSGALVSLARLEPVSPPQTSFVAMRAVCRLICTFQIGRHDDRLSRKSGAFETSAQLSHVVGNFPRISLCKWRPGVPFRTDVNQETVDSGAVVSYSLYSTAVLPRAQPVGPLCPRPTAGPPPDRRAIRIHCRTASCPYRQMFLVRGIQYL
ncbi:hypothetical protein J6590_049611 [Homalodisca vitripennis]|nr:hypothetical protein J6590_049611 [Homalodisca vitripennis]